jgi:hypothetical protein
MKKFLIIFLFFFSLYNFSDACTNFLITKGASVDGSCMITYAADSHTLYGELYFWPAADYPDNTYVDVYEWDTGHLIGKSR